MKFTKFIPVALALTLAAVPTFAANTDTVSSELTLTVEEYFNITEMSGAVKTASGTIEEDGSGVLSLSYTTPMAVSYRVVNNMKDKTFYIKARATGASVTKAMGGTAGAPVVAFANTATGEIPTNDAIADAIGGDPAVENNANVIAFTVTPGAINQVQGTISGPTMNSNQLVYVAQPGTFEIPFTFATTPLAGTFSSHDAAGTYKSTIVVTDVSATP